MQTLDIQTELAALWFGPLGRDLPARCRTVHEFGIALNRCWTLRPPRFAWAWDKVTRFDKLGNGPFKGVPRLRRVDQVRKEVVSRSIRTIRIIIVSSELLAGFQ